MGNRILIIMVALPQSSPISLGYSFAGSRLNYKLRQLYLVSGPVLLPLAPNHCSTRKWTFLCQHRKVYPTNQQQIRQYVWSLHWSDTVYSTHQVYLLENSFPIGTGHLSKYKMITSYQKTLQKLRWGPIGNYIINLINH